MGASMAQAKNIRFAYVFAVPAAWVQAWVQAWCKRCLTAAMTDVPPLVLKGKIDEVTVLCGVACARWVALGGATAGDVGVGASGRLARTRATVVSSCAPKDQKMTSRWLHVALSRQRVSRHVCPQCTNHIIYK